MSELTPTEYEIIAERDATIEKLAAEIEELRAVNIEQAQAIGRLTLGLHQ